MTQSRANAAIFGISLLGLYLELLFIRWIGTEIRIFAYLQNTVLVVCFLGLGIGLFTSRRPISVHRGLFALLILAAMMAIPRSRQVLSRASSLLSVLGEINIWAPGSVETTPAAVAGLLIGLVLMFGVMILVLESFIPIGRLLGRLLDEHPKPIVAYSVNVIGSLAGIWLFVGLSRLDLPPTTWFVVLVLQVLPFLLARKPFDWLALIMLMPLVPLVVAQRSRSTLETVWSPYQKLELVELGPKGTPVVPSARYHVLVNNTGYQFLPDLSSFGRGAGSTELPADRIETLSPYDVAALVHPDPANVL
ncbi:MAG: hypothetical protein KAI98_06910, partial [Gemmatimonadetes bacterium]|nr:hypothetical protein [Gemmatimonadota bacterium]